MLIYKVLSVQAVFICCDFVAAKLLKRFIFSRIFRLLRICNSAFNFTIFTKIIKTPPINSIPLFFFKQ